MAPELKELLRDAAATPSGPLDVEDVRNRARSVARVRRMRAGAAGLAVIAVLVGLAVPLMNLLQSNKVELIAPQPGESEGGRPGAPPETWESLPPAPIVPRTDAASVWTGTEMIVWGGLDPARDFQAVADGAAYNPETRVWRTLPDAPLTPTSAVSAVWTGDEMLVWTRSADGRSALAYEPDSDAWRVLPSPPAGDTGLASTVWTGTELLVWGGIEADGRTTNAGVAYNPGTDGWRELAAAPIAARFGHGAVWTGEEMVVWGGSNNNDGISSAAFDDGAAYDPGTDSWRLIADSPLGAHQPGAALWSGEEMLVFSGWRGGKDPLSRAGAAYDPAKDSWRKLPEIGLPDITSFAWAGNQVVAWGADASNPEATGPKAEAWLVLPGNPGRLGDDAAAAWTGEQLIIWGGQDDGQPVDDGAILNTAAYPAPGTLDRPPGFPGGDQGGDPNEPPPVVRGEASLSAPPDGDLPLWPTKVPEAVELELVTPTVAAEAFGRERLGWREPFARGPVAPPGADSTSVLLGPGVDGPFIDVRLHRLRVPGVPAVWRVTTVGEPERLDVRVDGRRLRGSLDVSDPGVKSAELTVQYYATGYGSDEAPVADGRAIFDARLTQAPGVDEPGTLLVLFRDQDGLVIGAHGFGFQSVQLD